MQASTRPCTEATDFSNMAFSSAGERDLDDALDAVLADHDRHADEHVLHAVLAVEIGRAGQDALLVLEVALGHGDGGSGGRVEGGAGLEQVDDLAAALAGALDHGVELLLGRPAHLHEVGQRDAGDRGIAHQRHHVVAVAAEHEGGHVLDRHVELLGEEVAEAGRIEHAGHADDLFGLQAGELLQRPDHGVERVGDADDEGVRGILLDAVADRFHDLQVDADQVVAAHAGLARHAGGDDDHVGACDIGIVVRALVPGIEPVDRRGFGDVETFALGNALRDVEEHDVAEFLQADEMGERAADLAGADERDLVPGHESVLGF